MAVTEACGQHGHGHCHSHEQQPPEWQLAALARLGLPPSGEWRGATVGRAVLVAPVLLAAARVLAASSEGQVADANSAEQLGCERGGVLPAAEEVRTERLCMAAGDL